MNYNRAIIFSKYTDMLEYFDANQERICGTPIFESHEKYRERVNNIRNRFAKARPVTLILLVRYERNQVTGRMKTICRIKCPINPMPTVGEFEAPSLQQIIRFLSKHGWEQVVCQSSFDLRLFE